MQPLFSKVHAIPGCTIAPFNREFSANKKDNEEVVETIKRPRGRPPKKQLAMSEELKQEMIEIEIEKFR